MPTSRGAERDKNRTTFVSGLDSIVPLAMPTGAFRRR